MKNKEKAKEYAESLPQGRISKKYSAIDFAAGATWKEQQLIDKAIKWMRSRQKGFINKIITITEKDIQDFKQIMKGE